MCSALKIRPLSVELQRKANEELNEDQNRIAADIELIKEWLKKQPHLNARTDDHFLLCFLRGTKFSVQRAKEKLDYFHTVKTLYPEYYYNRDAFSDEVQNVLKAGVFLPLTPTNGADGPRIILVRWGNCDPSKIQYQAIIKVFYMMLDIFMMEDDNAVVAGLHFVSDYKNFAPGYVLQMSPIAIQRSGAALQAAYPLRIRKLDFINLPKVFDSVFVIIKAVLSAKLRDRMAVYSDGMKSIKEVPQSVLPIEYGGQGESYTEVAEKWKTKIESYQEWFQEDSKYCSDEKLRPDEPTGDAFGINGTFRKLNVD